MRNSSRRLLQAAIALALTTSPISANSSACEQHPTVDVASVSAADMRRRNSSRPKPDSARSSAALSSESLSGNGSENGVSEMVPITKELLEEHYKQFPNPSLGDDLRLHCEKVREMRISIMSNMEATIQRQIDDIVNEEIPHGLDNMMYTIRCACEEAAERSLMSSNTAHLSPEFLHAAKTLDSFQQSQRQHVSNVIAEFLPKDFRGSVFSAFRTRSERSNQQALDELSARGGSVREKYALLWDQQWKRRENLAMVGNSTGVWKLLVRYIAGVPAPLLMFAKSINSPSGPTEALRSKFGGVLRELVVVANEMNALTVAIEHESENIDHEILGDCLNEFTNETEKFVELLNRVIVNSPFFVKADEVAMLRTDGN